MKLKPLSELIRETQAEMSAQRDQLQKTSTRLEELYLLRDLIGKYPHLQIEVEADPPMFTVASRPASVAERDAGVVEVITVTATVASPLEQAKTDAADTVALPMYVLTEEPCREEDRAKVQEAVGWMKAEGLTIGGLTPVMKPPAKPSKPKKASQPSAAASGETKAEAPVVRQNSREQVSLRGGVMTRIARNINYRCDTRKGSPWEVVRMTDNVVVGEVSRVDREDGPPGYFAKKEKRSGRVHNTPTAAMEQVIGWVVGW
jgi:hypothetical protein